MSYGQIVAYLQAEFNLSCQAAYILADKIECMGINEVTSRDCDDAYFDFCDN